MARILRGDVYWADLEPTKGREQAGRRPVLVLSHEVFNSHSGTVIALAITSQPQRAGFPLTYALPEKLLPKPSWVKISQVRTLSTERLSHRIAHAEETDVNRIIEGLTDIVGP
ncbi:MAG TPA: MazF family transcriptional regulator [Candidatus Omnitrophica bacterium]|nr:MAG: MazF family transcriptional regulator [Omnitrophica WOR_2 bacterium GWA2_63_20]OGX17869.1 MAG: MazF family transcriptional regulator [Omnitrophica WOR_2 bacterium GWF2_63_9]OGX32455.1 MAG: MazF family transcriptional regulator [Omnitrophica WOR_2 bacterium RIFCSPHIGHO2_12_FULL_64_13]OGX36273.1 MAG: MazF family transcriptional regulator [Omnitrophica WOR_2 bacterium RIFCSPHIGHO2_02_FULL_63_39]OGX46120.1 MAG: MazF family transcriptional regulator [Omnitrophica WOR_2 bacterium RIFCSPLOWO2_